MIIKLQKEQMLYIMNTLLLKLKLVNYYLTSETATAQVSIKTQRNKKHHFKSYTSEFVIF